MTQFLNKREATMRKHTSALRNRLGLLSKATPATYLSLRTVPETVVNTGASHHHVSTLPVLTRNRGQQRDLPQLDLPDRGEHPVCPPSPNHLPEWKNAIYLRDMTCYHIVF
jgi:hypothetical protein